MTATVFWLPLLSFKKKMVKPSGFDKFFREVQNTPLSQSHSKEVIVPLQCVCGFFLGGGFALCKVYPFLTAGNPYAFLEKESN